MRVGAMGMEGKTEGGAASPRLMHAAHAFEALMMKELLKPMTERKELTGEESEQDAGSGSGSGGALGEFAAEALGQALSLHGGFGIADRIVQSLSHSGTEQAVLGRTGNAQPLSQKNTAE